MQGQLDPQIGHQGTDNTALKGSGLLALGGDDVDQLIPIHFRAVTIDHQHSVAITIERNAQVRLAVPDGFFKTLKVRRAYPQVDIQPVGISANNGDRCAQFAEDFWGDVISGPMSAVQHDVHVIKHKFIGHGALAEFHVTARRIFHPKRLAQVGRFTDRNGLLKPALNFGLQMIAELGALSGEELDAVVVMGVVRSADNNTCTGPEGAGQIGNGRGRHGADEFDINAGCGEPRFKSRLEHVAGKAGILADNNAVTLPFPLERLPGGPAQTQHKIRRDRRIAHAAANTVCSKIPTR